MGMLKAMKRYLLFNWMIFGDFVCLWYPEDSYLMLIRICLALIFAYEHNFKTSLLPALSCEAPM